MHLVHEQNVLIADDPASFADAVVRLYTQRYLWERISEGGLENVREHFSIEAASREVDLLLKGAGLKGINGSGHPRLIGAPHTRQTVWIGSGKEQRFGAG
jgi:hypothetical protein